MDGRAACGLGARVRLRRVAAGLAITTIAPVLGSALPPGVATVAVRGEPQETRRLVLARRPGPLDGAVARLVDALLTDTPAFAA
jgi:hypothetical protein